MNQAIALVCFQLICAVAALSGFNTNAALSAELRGTVVDAKTHAVLPARVYLQGADGSWHFVRSAAAEGSAVRYEKRRGNPSIVEIHTTISAHEFLADLPPGDYTVTVERGKEYIPLSQQVTIAKDPVRIELPIRRWIDMAGRGWYSGETHLHRSVEELRNIVLAEDLNVAFALTYHLGKALAPASSLQRPGEAPAELISVDPAHVLWPGNTEYEIFTVGEKRHILGALFLLNHRAPPGEGVPPWGPVARKARADGAILDFDKLGWPASIALPAVSGEALYELSNNHLWRAGFGMRQWPSPAPPYLLPPYGGNPGSEREWIHYTLGMYYTLLNCGFRLQPSAGTASGVHPVPAGFGRVYVCLPEGFGYQKWLDGLRAGRSFVTTGPMLFAIANDRPPGEIFQSGGAPVTLRLAGTVISEQPLSFVEVIQNGIPAQLLMPQNKATAEGAFETRISAEVKLDASGWVALRSWEDRPGGRVRFAHTAPWHVWIEGRPLRPRAEEKEFLIAHMTEEMARSKAVLPADAYAEYEQALAVYQKLEVEDDSAQVARSARPPKDEADLRAWLQNMVWDHRFTRHEIRQATGLSLDAVDETLKRLNITDRSRPALAKDGSLRVLPYPGGRHPRSGFFDGAIDPQRETKVSIFAPWDPASYVVVDVPEAIFSNLGLLYLAHTHVPTIWEKQGIKLPPLEWKRGENGVLEAERTLPNGIRFSTKVMPGRDAVRMELWLHNGTEQPLTALRVQNCVMLKAAAGFSAQTTQNKLLLEPYAAVGSEDGRRWIITAWSDSTRTWANPAVPCIHADPKFPDCPPGQKRVLHGWLSFYEGNDIRGELKRIEATGWRANLQTK